MRKSSIIILIGLIGMLSQMAKADKVQVNTLYDGTKYIANQVVISCRPGTPALETGALTVSDAQANNVSFKEYCRSLGVARIDKFYSGDIRKPELRDLVSRLYILTLNPGVDCLSVLDAIAAHDLVQYAEFKTIPELFYTPNDPYISQQWYLGHIQTYTAWDYVRGDTTSHSIIAIIDTGINYEHADMTANIWINESEDANGNGEFDPGDNNGVDDDENGFIDDVVGWNFAENNNDPMEILSHGTGVAACASEATDNNTMGAGIGFSARLMAMKGISDGGQLVGAYECMLYAADNGANVINCSWGAYAFNQYEQDIINAVWAAGVVVVASGGEGNQLTYPAAYENVVAVTATDQNDHKASFGPYGHYIDLSAPGVNISIPWSAGFSTVSGTSFATGMVSGLVGLVWAWYPFMTNEEIVQLISESSDPIDHLNPGYNGQLGAGRINAANCVMTGIDEADSKPLGFKINDIHPNPFNSRTVISFALDKAADVEIVIYDIAGRRVDSFFLGRQTAGHKSVIWDAGPYSSGIYFCNICINNSVNISKMTLLK